MAEIALQIFRQLIDCGKTEKRIPPTYVPSRNTIFLSIALSYAEAIRARAIFIGANAIDFSGYPDCRPNYYTAFKKIVQLGTKCGVEGNPISILAPLLKKTKAQIIELGRKLGSSTKNAVGLTKLIFMLYYKK
ncbi:hypothetical protein AUJ66_04820 [Candidatus Desantisbacteria bacterium CG1_02_38_46]|uniref:7-cyano-7-deazaguanine synthase n=1 Tax=Candidatus Desantisbacteria bacterium CG1_02_38_46 TaxID=1817893 RepID=A0A1J4SC52_9BACT|nr:MAG: hypothetical protein AUJ66_04820 [Candidatus Desantisbacteria bacterium CG1_02_38_46]